MALRTDYVTFMPEDDLLLTKLLSIERNVVSVRFNPLFNFPINNNGTCKKTDII